MKVLHVIPSISLVHGGPSVTIQAMTRALASAGLDVHVATTDDDGQDRTKVLLERPILDEGVTYWFFRRQTRFYKFSLPLTRWLARNIRDYDLVHIHALFSYATLPAGFYAARSGVPYIVRPLGTLNRWGMQNHRQWFKRLSFALFEKRITRGAALVHYTSDQERLEAEELGIHQPYIIVPNPVDPSELETSSNWLEQNAPFLSGRHILLFLSRLDRKKGLDLLLPAFAELKQRHPKVGLVIAGNGVAHYVEELHRLARSLALEGDIYWAGFLNGEAKRGAFAAADVFVLPSYSENFGLAVAEAMAAGLPVVVSDQVGIHAEVCQARAGIVVSCAIDELTAGLLTLLEDRQLRDEMSKGARCLAVNQFAPSVTIKILLKAYQRILSNSR